MATLSSASPDPAIPLAELTRRSSRTEAPSGIRRPRPRPGRRSRRLALLLSACAWALPRADSQTLVRPGDSGQIVYPIQNNPESTGVLPATAVSVDAAAPFVLGQIVPGPTTLAIGQTTDFTVNYSIAADAQEGPFTVTLRPSAGAANTQPLVASLAVTLQFMVIKSAPIATLAFTPPACPGDTLDPNTITTAGVSTGVPTANATSFTLSVHASNPALDGDPQALASVSVTETPDGGSPTVIASASNVPSVDDLSFQTQDLARYDLAAVDKLGGATSGSFVAHNRLPRLELKGVAPHPQGTPLGSAPWLHDVTVLAEDSLPLAWVKLVRARDVPSDFSQLDGAPSAKPAVQHLDDPALYTFHLAPDEDYRLFAKGVVGQLACEVPQVRTEDVEHTELFVYDSWQNADPRTGTLDFGPGGYVQSGYLQGRLAQPAKTFANYIKEVTPDIGIALAPTFNGSFGTPGLGFSTTTFLAKGLPPSDPLVSNTLPVQTQFDPFGIEQLFGGRTTLRLSLRPNLANTALGVPPPYEGPRVSSLRVKMVSHVVDIHLPTGSDTQFVLAGSNRTTQDEKGAAITFPTVSQEGLVKISHEAFEPPDGFLDAENGSLVSFDVSAVYQSTPTVTLRVSTGVAAADVPFVQLWRFSGGAVENVTMTVDAGTRAVSGPYAAGAAFALLLPVGADRLPPNSAMPSPPRGVFDAQGVPFYGPDAAAAFGPRPSAVDAAEASITPAGVAVTELRVDGSTGPFSSVETAPRLEEGVRALEFRSRDAAGNLERTRTATVRIDASAPASTAAFSAGSTLLVSSSVLYTSNLGQRVFSATETTPGSGLHRVEVAVDSGPFVNASTLPPFLLLSTAPVAYKFRAVDNVENAEPVHALTLIADVNGPPAQPFVIGSSFPVGTGFFGADPRGVSVDSAALVGLRASDPFPAPGVPGSGLASILFFVDATPGECGYAFSPDGNTFPPGSPDPQAPPGTCQNPLYSAPFSLAPGTHVVTAVALDRVDNAGPVFIGTITVQPGPLYAHLRSIGGPGSGPGQFNTPVSVAVSAINNLMYVSDAGNFRIQALNLDGGFQFAFGSQGTGNGQFGGPLIPAAGPAGDDLLGQAIVVADPGNFRVQRFSRNGAFLNAFGSQGTGPGQFQSLYWIAVDTPLAQVYATDNVLNRVSVFQQNGTFLFSFGGTGTGPGQFDGPKGIAVAPALPGFGGFGQAGGVFVVDAGNKRVQVFAGSQFVRQWSAPFVDPEEILIDNRGIVYVSDAGLGQLWTFDKVGNFLGMVGAPGAGPLELDRPMGMAADAAGRIYVADAGNHRVQQLARRQGDVTPPATPPSLAPEAGPYSVDLAFAAVGNDGSAGRAALYDLRFSTVPIAGQADYERAAPSLLLPGPKDAGTPERLAALGLSPLTTYYFGLRVWDDSANASGLVLAQAATPSNVALGRLSLAAGGPLFTLVSTTGFNASVSSSLGNGGPATLAFVGTPRQVAVAGNGDLQIAQMGPPGQINFSTIRRVSLGTGVISGQVGAGAADGFSGDGGPASAALLRNPQGVSGDRHGSLFVSDTGNHRVRKVNSSGVITTAAGTGAAGFSGDGGPGTSAQLNSPRQLASDPAGNMFVADSGNHRVRRLDAATGVITTVAGDGTAGFSGDGGPAAAARLSSPQGVAEFGASGDVFIADTGNHRVRKVSWDGVITTVAGTGAAASTGDGGPAASASLNAPTGLALDPVGNLFIVEQGGHRVRRVDAASGLITTVAGTGTPGISGANGQADQARLDSPTDAAVLASRGLLYVSDSGNDRVVAVGIEPFATVSSTVTVGGVPEVTVVSTGTFELIAVTTQAGVGAIVIASASAQGYGAVTPLFELEPQTPGAPAALTFLFDPASVDTNTVAIYRFDGTSWSSAAVINQSIAFLPGGFAQITGTALYTSIFGVFVPVPPPADQAPPLVRLDFPSPALEGVERVFAGTLRVRGEAADENPGSWTLESAPGEDASSGFTAVAAGTGGVSGALAAWDTSGSPGWRTLRLSASDAFGHAASTSVSVFIGTPTFSFSFGRHDADVIASPVKEPTGIAARADGLLWIASAGRDSLLLATSTGAVLAEIEHPAGTPKALKNPQGLALDAAGNLYAADKGRDRVLKLSPDGATVLLELGGLSRPRDVAVDANGDIYAADSGAGRVRVFDAAGTLLRDIGPGVLLSTSDIRAVALSASGLWVSDRELEQVWLFSRAGQLLKTVGDADSSVGEISRTRGLASDRAGSLYVIEPNRDRAQKFDPEGRGMLAFGPKSMAAPAEKAGKRYLNKPVDAAVGPDGALWIADAEKDRIVRYSIPAPSGGGYGALSLTLPSPASRERGRGRARPRRRRGGAPVPLRSAPTPCGAAPRCGRLPAPP